MKINKLNYYQYQIPFRNEFVTTKISLKQRTGIILELITENGFAGYSEVAPLPGMSVESLDDCKQALAKIARLINNRSDKNQLTDQVQSLTANLPSLRFGIETAVADLNARLEGMPLSKWFNNKALTEVKVNALLYGDLSTLKNQLLRKLGQGFHSFKLKVGSNLEDDIKRIEYVRNEIGVDAELKLDANQCWSFDQAQEILKQFAKFNPIYIEEPLVVEDINRIADLRDSSGVEIALDETIYNDGCNFKKLDQILSSGAVRYLVVKPMMLGGIRKLIQLQKITQMYDCKLVFSSSLECGIGWSSVLHLAATFGQKNISVGIDTLDMLTDSLLIKPPQIENGKIKVPTALGLGVQICNLTDSPYVRKHD